MANSTSRDTGHIAKFDGTNFPSWKFGIWMFLEKNKLTKVVDGTQVKPEEVKNANVVTNAKAIEEWCQMDVDARTYIYSTINNEQQCSLHGCTTAAEMWTRVTTEYAQTAADNEHLVMAKFFYYKYQPGHSVMAHVTAIEQIAAHLKDLGSAISDVQVMSKILHTLPPSFRHFLSVWDNVPTVEKTIKLLTTRLVGEESRTKQYNHGEQDPNDQAFFAMHSPQPQAFFAQQGGSSGKRGNGRGRKPDYNRSITCDYCHIKGHTSAICRNKVRDSQGKGYNRNITCDYCHKRGHSVLVCRNKMKNEPAEEPEDSKDDLCLVSALCLAAIRPCDWYADSGATEHMSNQRSAFTTITAISGRTVTGIKGVKAEVHGRGDVRIVTTVNNIKRTCVLKEALHVPELGFSFLSIASVTDAGAQVLFFGEQVWLGISGRVEMTGRRVGKDLYRMNIELENNNQQVEAAVSEMQVDTVWPVMQVQAGLSAGQTPSLDIWHQRLAHQNVNTVLKMSEGVVDGLKIENSRTALHMPCNGCILGKIHRFPFPTGRNRANEIGGIVHSDVCGPMQVPTPNSGRFFVLFKDDASRWCVVHVLKQKSEVFDLFVNYVALLRKETGKEVKILRSDNGGEFCSTDFKNWLAKKGIRHETSSPHTPQQNGVSERANRTIMEAVRSQMHSKSVPLTLWGEMVVGTVYVLNRSLSKTSNVTPFEAWYGRKPDVSHLRTLGSRAFAHVPDQNRRKLDPKAEVCILVGYSLESKAYRLWNPCTRRIVISRNVIVDENMSNDEMTTDGPEETPPEASIHSTDVSTFELESMVKEQNAQQPTPEVSSPMHATGPVTYPSRRPIVSTEVVPHVSNETAQHDGVTPRRSKRTPVLTERYKDFMGLKCATGGEPNEPKSYQEAVTSEEANLWREAIKDEYDSHEKNGTWVLATLPPGRTAIKSRWVFKFKPGYDEVPERFKARLVAKGYTQQYGIDYHDTYAPVVKTSALRMILAMVAALDLEMTQLDVKTAFLHGILEEEIYMEQPEGFLVVGQEKKVCRLVKSIYGLKQAPRTWNTSFNDFLLKFGLKQSSADPCVYYRRKNEEITIVAIYVDDGLVCSSKTGEVTSILSYLGSNFEMRSLPASRFVGLEISRDRVNRQLSVTQSGFVNKLLEKCGMRECNPKLVPADPCTRLDSKAKPRTEKQSVMVPQATPYRETVGSLMYLMVMSRPDIAFAVNQVSKHCENPEPVHWNAVKRILAYLAGTTYFGLCFSKGSEESLVGYTDADYAGDIDTRRSTTGFVFLLHGGPVSWTSKQQSCTSLSTTESEYVAACETTKEAVWLSRLINEMELKKEGAVPLWCDNQSAIRLVRNPEFHQRTKHIDVKYHYIREQQINGKINVQYVATQDQLADIFTKPLAAPRFEELRDKIGVKSNAQSVCRV